MHFCFLDHLHLSIVLKVISLSQLSPCFSLKLQNSPWFSSSPFFFLASLLSCSVLSFCRRRSPLIPAAASYRSCLPCHALPSQSPHRSSSATGAPPERHVLPRLPALHAGAPAAAAAIPPQAGLISPSLRFNSISRLPLFHLPRKFACPACAELLPPLPPNPFLR
jgi:hypothetical protein